MARLFSTTFNYRNLTYIALVTITGSDDNSTITIKVPDPSLHDFLPGGKVTLDAQKRIQKNEKGQPKQDLIDTLMQVVQNHENNKAPRSLWN